MANATHTTGYRLYWHTWLYLLALTAAMLGIEFLAWPQWVLLAVLLSAMLVKAGFIAANFMHLRFERALLIWIVAGGLLATAAVLIAFLAVDALHVLRLSSG
jgi:cytochrome c oxidase subunit IV